MNGELVPCPMCGTVCAIAGDSPDEGGTRRFQPLRADTRTAELEREIARLREVITVMTKPGDST